MSSLHIARYPMHTTGNVPLDPVLTECLEKGRSFIHSCEGSPSHSAVVAIATKIDKQVFTDTGQSVANK